MQEETFTRINYIVVDGDSPPLPGLLRLREVPWRVPEIKQLIEIRHGFIGSEYLFYQTNIPYKEELPAVLSPIGEPLPDTDLVSKHWPNGFSSDVFDVILYKPPGTTDTIPPKPRVKKPNIDALGDDEGQAKVIAAVKKYHTSTLAKPSQFNQFQATEVKIFNGRPQEADGPPIGLFNPVFDSFQGRIASDTFAPTALQLSNILPLLTASQKIYDSEPGPDGRTAALTHLLEQILTFDILEVSMPKTKSDGLITEADGPHLMFMEVKNEIGTGGCDPSVQGAIAYVSYWGQAKHEWLRQQCCCPSMILAIAGPHMSILGGIMLKRPVIQPLTPYFLVGNNPSSPGHANEVAKIFASLAASLQELRKFYRDFRRTPVIRNPMRHYPYLQHFTLDGKRVDLVYTGTLAPTKAVFRGTAQPEGGETFAVIVKFAESYNATAHRTLEEMNLAPKLIFISSEGPDAFKVAGRIMVVMEDPSYHDLSQSDSPPDCVLHDVRRALDALHKKNLVFGDLRPPNILSVREKGRVTGAMLIDFDWCGTAGEAKYPMDINFTLDWPEGVGPGLPMFPEHDNEMLKRLSAV
ncbi:hypothetical protein RSOLAG22IIIB_03080 [Rhizoctonia solani]|uniref:Protein kinase domain-containing protein n=1 Tax=Rhizoctonia solani TaxID=456999 RepID=A0A0K6FN82_9AGAM|nr:hypothetical protein RSOLAG22IIIB_03080 [Rhizoctonia solani]